MFEFVRNHKRWMQILLALLIVPSFVVVGVSSYGGGNAGGPEVANVGGTKITQAEWDEAQRQQIERYRGMMGAQFDQKMFETPERKHAVLDQLVAERALNAELARNHVTVGVNVIQKAIMDEPAFHKADGSFDLEAYKSFLKLRGLSAAQYEASIRRQLSLQQLNSSVESSAFAPRTVSTRLSESLDQEREVQELLFPASDFSAQVKVTDDMVKAFYDKNAALFQVPEQARIEYVVLDAAAVESQVAVTDAEVAAYYEANKKNFTTREERQASHILITVKKDASAAEKAAAKAKADAVLAEVRKAPANFAAIAKAQSQDPVSAEQGGDLGVVEAKGIYAGPIEDAVYKLKQGEISDVVASDFGYHIITLTRLAPESVKSLDTAKGDIMALLKQQKMSKKYSELAQTFSEMVYDQSDSLKPVADKLKLKIQTADNLTRTPNPALGKAPFNDAKFLTALFAADALKNKRNTEAVEVGASTLIAGRVVDYKPASKRPLAELDAVIRQRVAQEEAAKLARKAGEAKLAAAKASGDAAGFGEAKVVTRTKQPTIHPAAAAEVLKADVSKLPAYVGVDVPGIGFGVYRIGKVGQPAQPDLARRASEREQIAGALGQQELFSYLEALKQKAKAKVLVKNDLNTVEVKEVPAK